MGTNKAIRDFSSEYAQGKIPECPSAPYVSNHSDLGSARNPSLRRVRLADFDLSAGAAVRALAVEAGPFFADMAAAFA